MHTALRRHLRYRRSQLDPLEQAQSSQAVIARLLALPVCQTSRHIAIYSPVQGEIDITPLLEELPEHHFYFPVMRSTPGMMDFYPVRHQHELVPNRFGIPEPCPDDASTAVEPNHLDLVFLPLVAFDLHGHRLGTGGGYYDRYFTFRRDRSVIMRPVLLGVAYDFQRQDSLTSSATDVPLDGVVTESTTYFFADKDEAAEKSLSDNGSI